MICRYFIPFLFLLLSAVPASGINSSQGADPALSAAEASMKAKDYEGAKEAAFKATDGGARDFLLGMACFRLTEWEQAAEYLGKAVTGFPILADYAAYNRSLALQRLARYGESLTVLEGFATIYPESPLIRSAEKLRADLLFDSGDFTAAYASYQSFIEKYPSGSDALEALHRLALCLVKKGDPTGAVAALRSIWLKYPASAIAASAEDDLRNLAQNGVNVAPYSAQELFRRGTILFDLGKYEKALKTFNAITISGETEDFIAGLLLKTGQAQLKARHFKDAEHTFSDLLSRNPRREIGDGARYWLAKTIDRRGREDEAFAVYTKLSESSPKSGLADDALLAAAFIRKFQNRSDEELSVLKTLVRKYPGSNLAKTAFWEIGLTSYQAGDLKTAAECFLKLLDGGTTRDRALYWYGRTLEAAGDGKGAAGAFSALAAEYPLGFYSLLYRQNSKINEGGDPALSADICELLPLPPGYERAKALIALGLYEEAGRELAVSRRKLAARPGMLTGLARLYLEMGDFHASYSLLKDRQLGYPDKSTLTQWGIAYPLAFRREVTASALKCGVPESLVYAVIRAESNYFPTALSPAGAVGLMQVMPATAAAVAKGRAEKYAIDRLVLPETNIRLGVRHLKDLLRLYDGDQVLAVAAYNAGS